MYVRNSESVSTSVLYSIPKILLLFLTKKIFYKILYQNEVFNFEPQSAKFWRKLTDITWVEARSESTVGNILAEGETAPVEIDPGPSTPLETGLTPRLRTCQSTGLGRPW